MSWWVTRAIDMGGVGFLAAWVIWIVVAITLHELAHGWAAIRRGDHTPIHTGHMTWNPVVHMGATSLIVFALTGIAWGMMPVDPTRLRGRYAEAYVAFAGPLMNFSLAVVCVVAGGIIRAVVRSGGVGGAGTIDPQSIMGGLWMFFGVGCALNITLGLFNLLPAPPLDGSRVLANFWRPYREFLNTQGGQFMGVALFMVAFFFAGRLIGGVGFGAWQLGTDLLARLLTP
jgi:Zn-dependent protease